MEKIIRDFLNALFGFFIYWGLVQYTDMGTIHLIKLLSTPEPWLLAISVTVVTFLWKKYKQKKAVKKEI